MNKDEAQLAYTISEYLTLQYPDVIFRWDLGGIKLTIGQAKILKNKLLHKRGYPDLFIAEPRGKWCGMFLELKKDRGEVWLKDGKTMRKIRHIQEQADMLCVLMKKGYYATFAWGWDDCRLKIDDYLNLKGGVK